MYRLLPVSYLCIMKTGSLQNYLHSVTALGKTAWVTGEISDLFYHHLQIVTPLVLKGLEV